MRFALVDGIRSTASKGAKGICPLCTTDMIAKCGLIKINHWAHKAEFICDHWWENETEWHRGWKNNYQDEWQENIKCDETTGEKHIADIRTTHNLVIEFQHSQLSPRERISRERFYKQMVWVIDCTRRSNDYDRFTKGAKYRYRTSKQVFEIFAPEKCFPKMWIGSSVPVIFDFKGLETFEDPNDPRNQLYCLFPTQNGDYYMMAIISRKYFINSTKDGEWLRMFDRFLAKYKKSL